MVEARKGDRYGSKEVDILPEQLIEVALTLHAAEGRIFIETEENHLEVFLDGRSLDPVGEGLFKDISVGSHEIELKGKERYWKGSAELEIGKTTQVKAEPVGIGRVAFDLPEEAAAGRAFTAVLQQDGKIVVAGTIGSVIYGGPENLFEGVEELTIEGGRKAKKIVCMEEGVIALAEDGTVWRWGYKGAVGYDHEDAIDTTKPIPLFGNTRLVAAGGTPLVAYTNDGILYYTDDIDPTLMEYEESEYLAGISGNYFNFRESDIRSDDRNLQVIEGGGGHFF